jgi:SPOR domain
MKKKHRLLLLLAIGLNSLLFSQDSTFEGKVEIIQDYQVKELLAKHISANQRNSVKGYRIKIHFGADKSVAYKMKAEFEAKYDSVAVYVHYDQPYFNVTVGNYRTKLEAYKFLKEIQTEYTAAFLVQDTIEFIEKIPKEESEVEVK